MIVRRTASVLFALVLCSASLAQDSKTSTPEERKHWVEVFHHLEDQPLNQKFIDESAEVLKRIIIVEDFHVSVCYVTDLHEKDYKNVRPVSGLMFLGVAAYQIENGDTDKNAATLYALHSVLKGYANILSQDPQAKDKKLDELAKLNAEGKLPKLIQKKCK